MRVEKYGTELIKGNYNGTYVKKEFGENLVMFQLMTYKGWDVENVDYVGVDLIAIDTNVEEHTCYAIQVKLRQFGKDKNGNDETETNSSFTFDSEMKLRAFADKMSLNGKIVIPVVAYVNINCDQSINTILVNVDDLSEMRREMGQENGITEGERGYICHTDAMIEKLLEDPRVTSYRYVPEFRDNRLDGLASEKEKTIDIKYNKYITEKKNAEREKVFKRTKKYNTASVVEEKDIKNEKDGLVKHQTVQKGTFGEWYYMFKEIARGNHPFLVQSVGVDILSLENNTNKLSAISVKTFSKKENDAYTFELSNEYNMRDFCDKWEIEPENRIVALQFLIYREKVENGEIIFDEQGMPQKEYYKMYNFEMNLDYFTKTAEDNFMRRSWDASAGKYLMLSISEKNNSCRTGYRINWGYDNLEQIMADKNITFNEVYFGEPRTAIQIAKEMKLSGIDNEVICKSLGLKKKMVENI